MPTTTIRIRDNLKARAAAAAERAGKTTHAFIPGAIAEVVTQAEVDDAFHRLGEERWANLLETGRTVAWADAKAWLDARCRGQHQPKPVARRQPD